MHGNTLNTVEVKRNLLFLNNNNNNNNNTNLHTLVDSQVFNIRMRRIILNRCEHNEEYVWKGRR